MNRTPTASHQVCITDAASGRCGCRSTLSCALVLVYYVVGTPLYYDAMLAAIDKSANVLFRTARSTLREHLHLARIAQ